MPHHHSSHHSSSHHSSSHHTTHHTHHTPTTHHLHHTTTGATAGLIIGRRRRFGCLGVFLLPVIIMAVVVGAVVFALNRATSAIPSRISIPSLSSGNTDLSADPTVVADLSVMHNALDKRIAVWDKQTDVATHTVNASEAGLPADFNTKAVVYGRCTPSQFFVFVLNETRPEDTTADTEGYEYLPGGSPAACAPTGWHVMSVENAAPDWYFVTIDTTTASPTATHAA